MKSDTRWGRELHGISPLVLEDEQDALVLAARNIETCAWDAVLRAVSRAHHDSPTHGAALLEFASAVHLTTDGDLHGTIARLYFSLGRNTPALLSDALAEHLANTLLDRGEASWAALAWALHSDGQARIRALVDCGDVKRDWLSNEGYEELEALVFERADATGDAGWQAMSALLAARDTQGDFDERTMLALSTPSDHACPRAWGVRVQVLLALEHADALHSLVTEAIRVFGTDARALLELLDASNADAELELLVERLSEIAPELASARSTRISEDNHDEPRIAGATNPLLQGSPASLIEGALLLLPEPPRRTDDEWLERKKAGDSAMKDWLSRWVFIGLAVIGLVGTLLRLL